MFRCSEVPRSCSNHLGTPGTAGTAELLSLSSPSLKRTKRLIGHVFTGLGGGGGDHLLDRHVRIAHRRLVHQADLRVVALELALDDLVDHVGRLVLAGELRAVNLFLLLERLGRDILALDELADSPRRCASRFPWRASGSRRCARRSRSRSSLRRARRPCRPCGCSGRSMPSLATRPARLAACARPFLRRISTAFSMSPPDSSSAALQSIMPAPVLSRSSFTCAAVAAISLLRNRKVFGLAVDGRNVDP